MKKILLVFFYFATTLVACTNDECQEDLVLKDKIRSSILESKKTGKDFNFATVADFEWDSLIIIGSYYPLDRYSEASKVDLSCVNNLKRMENLQAIVFTKNRKVISMINHPEPDGAFEYTAYPLVYTKKNAVFKVMDVTKRREIKDSLQNFIVFYK